MLHLGASACGLILTPDTLKFSPWVKDWLPGGASLEGDKDLKKLVEEINEPLSYVGLKDKLEITLARDPEGYWHVIACRPGASHYCAVWIPLRGGNGEKLRTLGERQAWEDRIYGLTPLAKLTTADREQIRRRINERAKADGDQALEDEQAAGEEAMRRAMSAHADDPEYREARSEAGATVSVSVPAPLKPGKKG